MNELFKSLSFFSLIAFSITACSPQAVRTQPEEPANPKGASYQAVLGKSLDDTEVADFIASHNCSPVDPFTLCKQAGMAFWADSGQFVKVVYLYSGNAAGFGRYRGDLPFGLSFYDPMWRVEEKLRNPNSENALLQNGLPEEAGSPDHIHYWAMYRRLDMTVIYNSPAADEDAYIYAILLND